MPGIGGVPSKSDALFDGGKPCRMAVANMNSVHKSKSQHKLYLLIQLQGTSKTETKSSAKQSCGKPDETYASDISANGTVCNWKNVVATVSWSAWCASA